jgi:hypothetical protein
MPVEILSVVDCLDNFLVQKEDEIAEFQGFSQEKTAYIQIFHVWQITVCICFASTSKSVLDNSLKVLAFH